MALNKPRLQADLEAFFRERPFDEPTTRARWATIIHDYTELMAPPFGFAGAPTWTLLRGQARAAMDSAMIGLSSAYGGCDGRVLEPLLTYTSGATGIQVPGVPTPTACRSTRIGDGLAAFAATVAAGVLTWTRPADTAQIVLCVPPPDRFRCPVLRTIDIPGAAAAWATDIHNWFQTGSYTTRIASTTALPLPWA